MLWSSVEWVGEGAGGGGRGARGLLSNHVPGLWLDTEEETTVSIDLIGYNFKTFRGHTFMMATKNDQFCDPMFCAPLPPSVKMNNRSFI